MRFHSGFFLKLLKSQPIISIISFHFTNHYVNRFPQFVKKKNVFVTVDTYEHNEQFTGFKILERPIEKKVKTRVL